MVRLKRVIDCTYLAAVHRVLRGDANSTDDLRSFLRFIGEVLVSDRILYTADPMGPVYTQAQEAVAFIQALGGRERLLQHFSYTDFDYRGACERAAKVLSREVDYLIASELPRSEFVSPVFDSGVAHPDTPVHDMLMQIIATGQPIPPPRVLTPGSAVHFVLSQGELARRVVQKRVILGNTSAEQVCSFAAAIRTFIYHQVAACLTATYLPSSSRVTLLQAVAPVSDDRDWGVLMDNREASPAEDTPLVKLVDGLVHKCEGEPSSILREAFQLRDAFRAIRGFLRASLPGDACLFTFEEIAEFRALDGVLNSLLSGERRPAISDFLDVTVICFAIPNVRVRGDKFREWFKFKRRAEQIQRLARFIFDTKPTAESRPYRWLKHNAGLTE